MAITENIYRQETDEAQRVASPAPASAPAIPAQVVGAGYSPGLSLADVFKDPTILAFLRSSGLSEQVMANEIARRQAATHQALGTNLQDLEARGVIQRRNISGSNEARGIVKSGQNLRDLAEQEAQQARLQGAMQQQAANQISDLSGNLAMKVAQNQQQAAELGTRTYIDRALAAGKGQIDSTYSTDDPYESEQEEY